MRFMIELGPPWLGGMPRTLRCFPMLDLAIPRSPALQNARRGRRTLNGNQGQALSDTQEQAAKSAVTFMRLTAGRSNGRRESSVIAAWHFRRRGENQLGSEFLPESNESRHVSPPLRP